MGNNMDSIMEVFLFEGNTLLEQLDEILLKCEKQDHFDTDSINEIFRIMHTIKGSSAMMQFNSLATISHKIEDLFYYVRENGIGEKHHSTLFDLMFKSSDFLKNEMECVEQNKPLSEDIGSFEEEINSFLKNISDREATRAADEAAAPAPAPVEAPAPETEAEDAPPEPEAAPEAAEHDETAPAEAGAWYGVRVFFDEGCLMENLRAFMLVNQILNVCNTIRYEPTNIQEDGGGIDEIVQNGFLICVPQESDVKKALNVIENFVYVKNYTTLGRVIPEGTREEHADAPATASTAAAAAPAASSTPAPAAAKAPAAAPAADTAGSGPVKQSLINVNLTKLDNLMDIMGEIVITESMVTAIPTATATDMDAFTKSSRQLRKLTDELQEIVMSIRMVPVSGVFQKMNRIVRDMSKKLNKEVELTLLGEETEVDKTIVDSIGDPLMHLVRNAMDHGIEEAEERALTGKPAKASVILSAQNKGGEILITVQDDGKGMDPVAILKKAKERGLLIKPEAEYTPKEIYNFLLMPGFSTNAVITEFSGRGVGMDVVKKNVEKIGGDISIDSAMGKGSSVLFKIPLTLAIMDGMEIRVGGSEFTIPINNIIQSFKANSENVIYDTDQNEIIMVRDQYYPVIRLHEVFGAPTEVTDITGGILILVEASDCAYCIFADCLLGEQQVVVKPLPMYLKKYNIKDYGISGCTILGDGSISLILDVQSLRNN